MAVSLVSAGAPASNFSPSFGQPTTAGNLLVLWLYGNDGASSNPFSTTTPGWEQAVVTGGPYSWGAIWYKANCAANETPPTFTDSGASESWSCLAEFSGAIITNTLDQSGSSSASVPTQTVSTSAPDSQSGDLIIGMAGWNGTNQGATISNTLTDSSGATVTATAYSNSGDESTAFYYDFVWGIATGTGGSTDTLAATLSEYSGGTAALVSFAAAPAVYTLFGQPTADMPSLMSNDADPYTMGIQFSVSQAGTLGGIWFYSPPGAADLPQTIALYTVFNETPIHQETATWSSYSGNGWVYAAFSSPLLLQTNTSYIACVCQANSVSWYSATRNYWDTGPGASGIANGPLAAPRAADSVNGQDSFFQSNTLSYPSSNYLSTNYWIDVSFAPGENAYDETVSADTPVAWWKLADAAGSSQAFDSSSNGWTGTPAAVTFGNSSTPIAGNTSALFNGTSSTILTNLKPAGWTGLTVEAWVNLNGARQFGNPRIVAYGHTDNDNTGFNLIAIDHSDGSGQGQASLQVANGSTFWYASGKVLPSSGWTYLAGTWDGATIRMYVNGTPAGSASMSGTMGSNVIAVALGFNPIYTGDYIAALLSEIAVYNYALSDAQIAAHYTASGMIAPRRSSLLLANYA